MQYLIETEEEAAAFRKMKEELFGDSAVASIPIISAQRTPPPAWPDRGYVLARDKGASVWPYLEASLKRDGYKPLDSSHLGENEEE